MKIKSISTLFALLVVSLLSAQNHKQFELFDAMPYIDKPDLTSEGLLPIYLMYESTLTNEDPSGRFKVILDSTKVNTQAFVASLFPTVVVSTDIEEWYGNRNVDAATMKAWYQTVFDVFRSKNENVIIGNYGLPVANLNLRRFNRNATEDEIIDEWKRASAKRMYSGGINDYLSPSFYIATPDTTQWLTDMEISARYLKENFPDKKIYAYIWPQYYDFKNNPYFKTFMTPEIWKAILNGCYKYLDGAIIWSSVYDENHNLIHWQEERVRKIWTVTKEFISEKGISVRNEILNFPEIKKNNNSIDFRVFTTEIDNINSPPHLKTILLKSNSKNTLKNKPKQLMLIGYNSSDFANSKEIRNIINTFRYSKTTRNKPKKNGLWNISNKGISEYRNGNSNFFINVGSWIQNTDHLEKEYEKVNADFLIPRCFIVDDDTTSWEKEFIVSVKELKRSNSGKPIYAMINMHYWNNDKNQNQKVKKSTLDFAFNLSEKFCDGVIVLENNEFLR